MSKRITIVGTGYVGLVSGVGLADFGNFITCVDIDENKIKKLKSGQIPIYEPGLKEYLDKNIREGRLDFTTEIDNNSESPTTESPTTENPTSTVSTFVVPIPIMTIILGSMSLMIIIRKFSLRERK